MLPCGGGTQLQTGYPPRADRPYILLSTQRLNRILDYQPDDLTVTCEPGVTLAALQQTLSVHRQFLALDVPLPHRATLGGIVATNGSGFDRPAYGAARDLVIGLRAVMAGGMEVKGGGKVVKNVAGYDVCKLFTGAWGTLGVITELTFKVRVRPEVMQMLAWETPELATAARVGLALHHARLAGVNFLATNEVAGMPLLAVGLQGVEQRVEWQADEYARLAGEAGMPSSPTLLAPESIDAWRDRQARHDPDICAAARVACLPTDVASLLERLGRFPDLAVTAHCATGIISFATTDPQTPLIREMQSLLPGEAHLVWTRLMPGVPGAEETEVWRRPRADFLLHRSLKQSLDPNGTFSPGRFLGQL